jgi:hypothetical protein
MRRSRPVVRLDGPDRVLEAAERRRAVDELIEGQRRLQATVPAPADDSKGDTLVRMASLLGEQRAWRWAGCNGSAARSSGW